VADVFVSYARSDKARVEPLVAAIEAQGWSVWWDPAITPGQEFDRQIEAELKIAAAVLVVWTPTSVESRWVRGEARAGAERGILVPVRFAGADLPIDVRALHTTDLDGWAEDARSPQVQEVLRALGALVARPAAPPPATVIPGSAPPPPDRRRVAICVLPFANMSGDAEQEYFSDGISEDIITDLSKVSALAVTSRNSAFVYKGKHVDVPKVARELRVSHVLEGSVRKAGGRVRINAQLVDAASNDHVWAERYDRDLNDIFALQDEISQAIVKALKLKLLPAEKQAIEQRGTDNVDAYNLYLMAWQHYVNSQEKDVQRLEAIVRLCARATELDPGYARAWALMAIGQMLLCFAHGRKDDDGFPAAERALALDPELAEAHAAKARILARYGRYDEAFAEFEVALRLDPESYDVNRWVGYWKLQRQRPDDAIRYYEKAMTVMETDLLSAAMLGTCYRATGNAQGALHVAQVTLARAERRLAQDQNDVQALTYGAAALAQLRQPERAQEWMDRALVADPDNYSMRYNFACALAVDSRTTEAALDMLGPMFATIDGSTLRWAKVDPDLGPLREHPRFKALVAAAEARLAASDTGNLTPASWKRQPDQSS
jgi:adenylate cyclase